MVKFKFRTIRHPKRKRPFRLMDLPAEIRNVVYEHIALDGTVKFPFQKAVGDCLNIRMVSRQVRLEFTPIMCSFATFEIKVENWDFMHVHEFLSFYDNLDMARYLSRNEHLVLSIKPRPWEPEDKQNILQWLADCLPITETLAWSHIFHQSKEDTLEWKSRTGFLWKVGLQSLRDIGDELLNNVVMQWELESIIAAVETEGDRVDRVLKQMKQEGPQSLRAITAAHEA